MRHAVVFAVAAAVMSACAKAPLTAPEIVPSASTTPAAVYADFSGVSVLTYRVTECGGLRNCFAYVGQTRTIEMRLQQIGPDVSGLIMPGYLDVIPVTGHVSGDGELTLTGSREGIHIYCGSYGREIRKFAIRRSAAGVASGSLAIAEDRTCREEGVPVTAGEVSALTSVQPLPSPSGFAGVWNGQYVIRSCAVVGNPFCAPVPNEVYNFTLTLSSNGSVVNGQMTGVASVSGTSLGDQLTLGGSSSPTVSTRLTITDWKSFRDALGQLHGTFSFTNESSTIRRAFDAEFYFVTQEIPSAQALKK